MPSRFDRKPGRVGRHLVAGLAGVLGAADPAHATTPVQEHDLQTELHAEAPDWLGDVSFDFAMPLVNPADGSFDMEDLARLAEPAYGVVQRESPAPRTVSFIVPYEYARFFDSGNPLSPEDYERVKAFMTEEVRRQFSDNVIGFSWDQSDYQQRFGGDPSQLVVDHVSLKGTTSPEAFGSSTMEPDAVDPANLELGEVRASDASDRLREVLQTEGFDVSNMAEDIGSQELQFSREEYQRLYELAGAAGKTGTPEDMMYALVSDYNFDRVSDPAVQQELDSIVGSKRTVEVEITFKEGQKDRALIPLPLLLLLLLRRRKTPQPYETPIGPKREPLHNVGPETPKDGPTYTHEVMVDIEKNFYFYQPVVDRYVTQESPDVNEMAHDILHLWNKHDNELRARMGKPAEDHSTRPDQVMYAYMHALALARVMKRMREMGPQTPASTSWNDEKTKTLVGQDIEDHAERVKKWRTSPFNPDNKKA